MQQERTDMTENTYYLQLSDKQMAQLDLCSKLTNDVIILGIKFLGEGWLGEEDFDREETDDTD